MKPCRSKTQKKNQKQKNNFKIFQMHSTFQDTKCTLQKQEANCDFHKQPHGVLINLLSELHAHNKTHNVISPDM